MSQALKCYKHDSKIFNMAMIHIQGIWVWFYPIRECIPSLEYFRFVLSRAHAENVFQSVFRRPLSCYCHRMFSADQVRYTKTSVLSNMIYSSSFESALIFQNIPPKKSCPTRLGNKTERNLLNILSITHALLSESKIFFEEKFVYTTTARRTAAGSLKTQWWRRLSTNQGKE